MEGRLVAIIYRHVTTLRYIRTLWDYEDCLKDG